MVAPVGSTQFLVCAPRPGKDASAPIKVQIPMPPGPLHRIIRGRDEVRVCRGTSRVAVGDPAGGTSAPLLALGPLVGIQHLFRQAQETFGTAGATILAIGAALTVGVMGYRVFYKIWKGEGPGEDRGGKEGGVLSKKEETELKRISLKHPELTAFLEKTPWAIRQQYHLLTLLAEKAGYGVGAAFYYLPTALKGMEGTGWSFEQQYHLLTLLAEKAGNQARDAFLYLPAVLKGMKGTGWPSKEKLAFLCRLAEKAKQEVPLCFSLLPTLIYSHSNKLDPLTGHLFRLLDCLRDYNRHVVLAMIKEHEALFKRLGPDHFPAHFELYVTVFERWPRLGFNILEGLLEATDRGIIPPDLKGLKGGAREILHFIKQTNGFIPTFYSAWLKEGEGLLPRLKRESGAILRDEFDLKETGRIIAKRGVEYLLGLFQTTSPTSGMSFVKKSEQVGLLKQMIGAGDLRGHIPKDWRGKLERFELRQGDYGLKAGETADPEGMILEIAGGLGIPGGAKETELVAALEEYLKSNRGPDQGRKVREVLYRFASRTPHLLEAFRMIQGADYLALTLLEQLFGDRDALPKILQGAVEKLGTEHLSGKAKRGELRSDPAGFARSLEKIWNGSAAEEDRLEKLARALGRYHPEGITEKVFPLLKGDDATPEGGLRSVIQGVMDRAPTLVRRELVDEILSGPIRAIRGEKAKYEYRDSQTISIGLRAVKGPVYGLFGLSAGVCTAGDLGAWEDKNFKLFAITDEDRQQVVGYVQVVETGIRGKKYLTLPGINPSAEFIGTVDAQELYKGLIEKVIEFAKTGGYAGVYIPTDPNIHSNRMGIQKVIEKAGYRIEAIPRVDWNTLPKPYPFTDVYVVWEKS